jgi:endonuclease/exonuclease/phosphatase family metal-dependent hydrolase/uncharacterized protein (DUF2141 family)
MKMMCTILLSAFLSISSAMGQLKIVNYNCYHRPTSANDSNWRAVLNSMSSTSWYDSYYGTGNYGTIPKRPDILAVTELDSNGNTGNYLKTILNNLYAGAGANYQLVEIVADSYEDYAFIYDATTVELLDSMSISIGTRPALRGHFRPLGYTSEGSDFYLYNVHLKAYTGYETTRQSEVNAMVRRATGCAGDLPDNTNIVFLGDFNFTTSNKEAAYDILVSPNQPWQAFDPLAEVCSPAYGSAGVPSKYCSYSSSNLYSRIDFQFPSTELGDQEGLSLIPNTYHTFGNINGSTSSYYPVRQISDHLGIVADYQLPAVMSVSVDPVPSRVLVNTQVSVTVHVSNLAKVISTAGADELDYTITGSGAITGSASGTAEVLHNPNSHTLNLDTSRIGKISGDVTVSSSSQSVQNGTYSSSITIEVMAYPDANGDGMVDVGDLGILAANYGGSNKSWTEGDFNNDGIVDVGDLGILAANYGQGSTSGSEFNADYAKVFGATANNAKASESSDDDDSSVCSSLGLSLIAILAMMGLTMVNKLEE